MNGSLIVQVGGEDEPRVFYDRFTIGRGGSDIDLSSDEYVSTRHAQVIPDGHGTWHIEDLGSMNGTWIGPMRTYRSLLAKGDKVKIGHTVLTVVPGW